MIDNLKSHYQHLLASHGDNPQAVQHTDQASQYARFKILSAIDPQAQSILDVGCGLGDMFGFLRDNHFNGQYLGVDFLSDFIQLAQQKYRRYANAHFAECDISEQSLPQGYDYVLLSGVFNNKIDNNQHFMLQAIKKMYASANKGIAFNALSTYVDYQDDELFYTDPLALFDFCKTQLSPNVSLKHDYQVRAGAFPYEFTLFVYKESQR